MAHRRNPAAKVYLWLGGLIFIFLLFAQMLRWP
jgi:hypothetical protein